jgi:hypothetical protein
MMKVPKRKRITIWNLPDDPEYIPKKVYLAAVVVDFINIWQ